MKNPILIKLELAKALIEECMATTEQSVEVPIKILPDPPLLKVEPAKVDPPAPKPPLPSESSTIASADKATEASPSPEKPAAQQPTDNSGQA
jgi:hypothetical protein